MNFSRLLLNAHALVDNAYTAFLGQCYGKARFRHCIHGGGNQRNIQANLAGEGGFQAHIFAVTSE